MVVGGSQEQERSGIRDRSASLEWFQTGLAGGQTCDKKMPSVTTLKKAIAAGASPPGQAWTPG
jgi:hypothetical protein